MSSSCDLEEKYMTSNQLHQGLLHFKKSNLISPPSYIQEQVLSYSPNFLTSSIGQNTEEKECGNVIIGNFIVSKIVIGTALAYSMDRFGK